MDFDFSSSVNISPDFGAFLKQLTARDPAQRYPSAQAALAAPDGPAVRPAASLSPEARLELTAAAAVAELEQRIKHRLFRATSWGGGAGAASAAVAVAWFGATYHEVPLVGLWATVFSTFVGAMVGRLVGQLSLPGDLEGWVEEMLPDQPKAQLQVRLKAQALIQRGIRGQRRVWWPWG